MWLWTLCPLLKQDVQVELALFAGGDEGSRVKALISLWLEVPMAKLVEPRLLLREHYELSQ